MYSAFILILITLVSAIASELLGWFLIYRKEDYQRLRLSVDAIQSKIDKKKDSAPAASLIIDTSKKVNKADKVANKAQKEARKLDDLEAQLKTKQQLLATARFRTTLIATIMLIGLYQIVSRVWWGQVVAHLPFDPIFFIRGLSHRGLEGDDYSQCSFVLIYALTQMAVRANVVRFFDFVPKEQSGFSSFMPTDEDSKKK